MKNPFKHVQDGKQALESFVVKQQMYLLNSVIQDVKHSKYFSLAHMAMFSKRLHLLQFMCDKYYISQEELDKNIYNIDNIENEDDGLNKD